MDILILTITLRASFVHSLKEKRMVVKSIMAKLKNKFNISIIESENQDIHQSIVLCIASVCANSKIADSTMEHIITFIEDNCEAEIINIERESY
ncbi:hypothetical protein SAMN02745196_00531 [Clostridium collagenovorans DSM 3089]|uniref:YlxP-like protein n=1 Tax=Clostridium collagenovorans DSM 3089 TaxID=1121306 RepID=A0A1M5TDG6_9CLOT|nr:DUF503 domain-containing protein [Clostridium collagenovorans]SHH48754.1 hypothetical protein SAMN02745196_00531 [Clostridium collagenovorans DSM 3089]